MQAKNALIAQLVKCPYCKTEMSVELGLRNNVKAQDFCSLFFCAVPGCRKKFLVFYSVIFTVAATNESAAGTSIVGPEVQESIKSGLKLIDNMLKTLEKGK